MGGGDGTVSGPGRTLRESRAATVVEILLLLVLAVTVVWIGWRAVGPDPLARQAVVWVANVLMLLTIWAGLRARGQGWSHLGLRRRSVGGRAVIGTLVRSVVVFVAAAAAFVMGSVIAAPLAGTAGPAGADMSGYSYLQGNLPMLLAALAAVYVVSSFGEEAIYRGFLITRLEELGGGGRGARAAAVAGSAVVFGLIHFDWGLVGVVQTTVMGLALAVAYLAVGRSLWVLVLAHAYLDTLLLVQLYLAPA